MSVTEQIQIERNDLGAGVFEVVVRLDGHQWKAGVIVEEQWRWAWVSRGQDWGVIDSGREDTKDDATKACARSFVAWARGRK